MLVRFFCMFSGTPRVIRRHLGVIFVLFSTCGCNGLVTDINERVCDCMLMLMDVPGFE